MYVNRWLRKWIYAVSICLIIAIGCGAYILWGGKEDKTPTSYVINQVRIKVNDMMLFLEQHHQVIASDATIRETLRKMSETSGVNLLFSQLDGKVIFHSSPEELIQTIDLRNSLHYDLYLSRVDKDFFKIAFPVISQESQTQIGNAIFTVPADQVIYEPSDDLPLFPLILMISCVLIVFTLLWFLRKKINNDTIQPIQKLKYYSEAILKGDYEHKAEYGRMDEIGEVYAMFDQMRLEIMHLSKRRDEQDKAQKELVSNLSHDLKTPLTTVKAYLEAIRAGICPDMESVMEYIQVMQTNTQKMTALIDDLLLHALKELGQISVCPIEQYSKEILLNIIKPIAHSVRTAGITFIEPVEIPNALINVDANRLEQVISNLIANALKHTSPGDSIRIGIEQERDQLTVTIADTGQGILPQDMPFIFERYFKGQVDNLSVKQKNEGSGLGLSICKYIIEAHKGSISFKSRPGQGTTFYFSIPLC
ncbi:Signal transduction histidine kinase [Paenibacillus uliginis N3/975]|uniref:histidine kinase n=1 Tax=Paenibacillus uliginis N3/975 TaxID=1313296 RepID=A0A1X7HP63_9BACL|nr:HAMP domain-containing sensor histidine kinase [Paenibacillus uliginis]SMF90354.1 Signal transduction histidine kinase [Paenibacillus uliginis N3/975]